MKTICLFFLILISLSSYAQEEFIGKGGGISPQYERSKISDDLYSNTFGASIVTNSQLSFSALVTNISEVTYPTIIVGYISNAKEERHYGRVYVGAGPSFIQKNIYLGVYLNTILLLNSQSNYPTSLTGALGLMTTFNAVENGPNSSASFGAGLKQALGAKGDVTPVLGISFSKGINQANYDGINEMLISFSFAFNINM